MIQVRNMLPEFIRNLIMQSETKNLGQTSLRLEHSAEELKAQQTEEALLESPTHQLSKVLLLKVIQNKNKHERLKKKFILIGKITL